MAFILDVAGDNEALVARNATGITDVAGLRGKRVATAFASTAHYSLLAALQQAGLSVVGRAAVDLQPQASLAAWERGDVDAVYTWLPTLDELRKDGTQLIASRQLATAGKPTLDLGVVSTPFAQAHPDVVDTWRKVETRALKQIHDDPGAAAAAIGPEIGATPEDAANQLKQGVYLTEQELTSSEWLGTDGNPGNVAQNLQSAAQFLAEQKQIPARARPGDVPEGDVHEGAARCPRKLRRRPRESVEAPARAADPDGSISVAGVSHSYGGRRGPVQALGPLDLDVAPGEFLVLVGASGCGKSTLLRLIAGFERPTEGTLTVSGTVPVPGVGAGVVFQQPRLFPWRSVGGNVDLALTYAGVGKADRLAAREGLLRRVGLAGMADRKVWEISGGQQQRVAIARALAARTPLLLLDEPFAALDALTRERLQEDIRTVSHETGRTSVFVTHSADEAVFLGSRIIVLTARPGRVALDLRVDLPRSGVDPDELRGSPEYAELRAQVGHEVKVAAG